MLLYKQNFCIKKNNELKYLLPRWIFSTLQIVIPGSQIKANGFILTGEKNISLKILKTYKFKT